MPFVDRFLAQKCPQDHFDLSALKASDITSFVRKQATELGSVQPKHMVSSLRASFRYYGIAATPIQISRAVSIVSRLIRSRQFREFSPWATHNRASIAERLQWQVRTTPD